MMQRRWFMLSAIAALIGARIAAAPDATGIAAVLRKRLGYLRLDDTGVRRFADDLAAQHRLASSHLKLIGAAGPLYAGLPGGGHDFFSNGIRHGEERIITRYLLSSDYFANGANELRMVHYLGLYDPLRACGSPFARRVV